MSRQRYQLNCNIYHTRFISIPAHLPAQPNTPPRFANCLVREISFRRDNYYYYHCQFRYTAPRTDPFLFVYTVCRRSYIIIKCILYYCLKVSEWEEPTLELHRISRLDMGAYLCIATNSVPPSVSKRIKVSVDCEYYLPMLFVIRLIYTRSIILILYCDNNHARVQTYHSGYTVTSSVKNILLPGKTHFNYLYNVYIISYLQYKYRM